MFVTMTSKSSQGSPSTMLTIIISGCQTGADIAEIDAAIASNFPYGGWVSKGRRTSDSLPDKYIVQEMPTDGYPKRTEQNVSDSNGKVIFTHGKLSGCSDLTRKSAIKHGRPWLHMDMNQLFLEAAVRALYTWGNENSIEVLNVAGKSAAKDERIYDVVYAVIDNLLKRERG